MFPTETVRKKFLTIIIEQFQENINEIYEIF